MPSPIEMMIDRAAMKCVRCGAARGTCDCWVKCRCGHSLERGGKCGNPAHIEEDVAAKIAASIASEVVTSLRHYYPNIKPQTIYKHVRGSIIMSASAAIRETLAGWERGYLEAKENECRLVEMAGRNAKRAR